MMMHTTNPAATVTNPEQRIVIKFTAPGKTRSSFLRRIDVCTNRPVGTARKNALVLTPKYVGDLFTNLNKDGYTATWAFAESAWHVGPNYKGGYSVYRDRMFADIKDGFGEPGLSYEDAMAKMTTMKAESERILNGGK